MIIMHLIYFFFIITHLNNHVCVCIKTVPVSSVTLLPTMISVIAGQQMNITCATSYCNPPANITWYLSSEDVTDQSTFTINRVDGLAETVSLLLSKIGKADNGKQVHCVASNTPDKTVTSYKSTLNILCKCIVHSCQITL